MAKLRKHFTGGKQELDIENKLLPPNLYRYGQNITVTRSENSDVGAVRATRGNQIADTDFTTDITNVTIGTVLDNLNDRIYWFWVGPVREGIYEFDLRSNTTSRIIEFTRSRRILQFDVNSRVFGNVIGDLLYWTDNVNSPRKININRFRGTQVDPEVDADGISLISLNTNIITSSGNVVISSAFSSDLIGVAKRPPLFPPSVINSSSTSNYGVAGTPLYENFISFSYRYKYRDGEITSMAPFSEPAFFPENFTVSRDSGILTSMVNRYNSIDIKFDVGDTEVTEVELLLKESNSGNVYVMTTINKEENGIVSSNPYQRTYSTFTYDANKIYRILPEDELTRVYDNVPLRARSQAFAGNRLIYGNYTDSYPLTEDNSSGSPVVIDFNLGYESEFKNTDNTAPSKSVKSDRFYEAGVVYMDRFGRQTSVLTPKSSTQARSNTVHVPFGNGGNRNQLTMELFSKAPYWATHWRPFIKETKAAFYNIFPETSVVDSANDRIYLKIPSLDQHTEIDDINGIQSTLNKVTRDDIIVLKANDSVETERREYRVVQVGFIDSDDVTALSDDGIYIVVSPVVPTDITNIPNDNANLTFETVPFDGNLDIYYEWGETFRCSNGLHTTSKEDIVRQDDNIQIVDDNGNVNSIKVKLKWFNCFSYSNGVESMHVRDEFFGRALEKGARASTVSEEYRERVRQNFLIHSGVFNDDVNLNRLNEFNISNPITSEVEINDGSIQYLHQRDTNLIVFQEDKLKLIPIDKNLIQTAGGNSQLTVDSSFFGTEQAVGGNYGISTHPESFASYGSFIYWVDVNRGCACRLFTGNGQIEEISRYGLENLFRGDARNADFIHGGYDEYHKRYMVVLRNGHAIGEPSETTPIVISTTGNPDPQSECSKSVSSSEFSTVYLSTLSQDLEIQVGDVVFVDEARETHFNGNFRWFRVRDGENPFTYDRVIQLSPDGIITSIIESCSLEYSSPAAKPGFNISTESFSDEFDACENGVADRIAYLGNPLNSDGTQGAILVAGSEPEVGNVIFEGKNDLVPSSRTGWFLITESGGNSVINVEAGVVIQKVSCASISLGRRRIQGSAAQPVIGGESIFDRNLRICSSEVNAITYYYDGVKDVPEVGDILYISNITDTFATASRFYTFGNGYFVLLDANSAVEEVGNCFTQVCTTDVSGFFTQDSTNNLQFTYNGINGNTDTLRGVEIEFVVIGDSRYPSTGFFSQSFSSIDVSDVITLSPSEVISETDVEVSITKICYRLNVAGDGLIPVFRTNGVASNGATLCGASATTTTYINNEDGRYYTDSQGDNLFDGNNLFYGIAALDNDPATTVVQINSDGAVVQTASINCAFQFTVELTYSGYTDGSDDNINESCGAINVDYYADTNVFSSASSGAMTSIISSDGSGSTPPDGIYSNKIVARRLTNGIFGPNLGSGCDLSADPLVLFYSPTSSGAVGACHISTTTETVYTDSDDLANATGIYEDDTLTILAADGFYSDRAANKVAQWVSTGMSLTFPSGGVCPDAPPSFTGDDAGFSATVDNTGAVTATVANGTLVSFMPSSVPIDSGENTITGVVTVPDGYLNSGENVDATTTVMSHVTPPPALAVSLGGTNSLVEGNAATLNASASGGSGGYSYSWSGAGVVNVDASSTTASRSSQGSVTYTVTVTDSDGDTVSDTHTVTWVSSTPTFLPSDAGFSVSVGGGNSQTVSPSVSNGTLVNGSLSPTSVTCGTGSFTATARVTVPSGYTNTGATVNVSDGASANACPVVVFGCTDSGATNYNPSATNDDGSCTYPPPTFTQATAGFSVSIGSGNIQTATASFNNGTLVAGSLSPSTVNCGTGSHSFTAKVTVPSGYANAGAQINVSTTASANTCPVSYGISASPTSLSYTSNGGTQSSSITTTPSSGTFSVSDNQSWITATKDGNNVNVVVSNNTGSARSGAVTVTHSNDSAETETISISQAAQVILYTIETDVASLAFDANGTPSQDVHVTTRPTDDRFSYTTSDSWIEVQLLASAFRVTCDVNGGGFRTGRITFTHLDDSTKTATVRVDQSAGGGVF